MTIGERIRLKRTEKKLTLETLAKFVGVSRQTIQRYETGIISNIPSDSIEKIAYILNVSPGYLMGWEDAESKQQEKHHYLIDFGNRVKQLRLERGLSQEELARLCGYTSRSTINKIELGINDVPQSKIKRLANALGVSSSDLFCPTENAMLCPTDTPETTVDERLALFEQLPPDKQEQVLEYMRFLAATSRKE